jgi:hypothetical protein
MKDHLSVEVAQSEDVNRVTITITPVEHVRVVELDNYEAESDEY